mgnify:FL=1
MLTHWRHRHHRTHLASALIHAALHGATLTAAHATHTGATLLHSHTGAALTTTLWSHLASTLTHTTLHWTALLHTHARTTLSTALTATLWSLRLISIARLLHGGMLTLMARLQCLMRRGTTNTGRRLLKDLNALLDVADDSLLGLRDIATTLPSTLTTAHAGTALHMATLLHSHAGATLTATLGSHLAPTLHGATLRHGSRRNHQSCQQHRHLFHIKPLFY